MAKQHVEQHSLEDEKGRWELLKLQAEVRSLNKSPWKTPGTWLNLLGVVTVAVAAGVGWTLKDIELREKSLEFKLRTGELEERAKAANVTLTRHGDQIAQLIETITRNCSELDELAKTYKKTYLFQKSADLYEQLVKSTEFLHGPGHPQVATALESMGLAYRRLERPEEAVKCHERAVAIWEETPGFVLELTRALNHLAGSLGGAGRTEQSELLLRRALHLREQSGADSDDVGVSVMNLGLSLQNQGKLGEAKQLYGRAMALVEGEFTENRANLKASILLKVAAVNTRPALLKKYVALSKKRKGREGADAQLQEAEKLVKEVRSMYQEARETYLSHAHPSVGTALNNYGVFLKDIGEYDTARDTYERALAIFKQALGDDAFATRNAESNLLLLKKRINGDKEVKQ